MKNKEFAALGKLLLPDLPGFVVKSPMVFSLPVKYVLRGLYFERSGFDKETFYAWVFFLPLYVPTTHVGFTFGKRLRDHAKREQWNALAPNLIDELVAAVKREALPFLSGIESPRDVVKAAKSLANLQNPYLQEALAYSLARAGDGDDAVAGLDQLVNLLDRAIPWQREMADRAQALRAKLIANPPDAEHQLDAWETESLRNLGVESSSR